MLPLLVWGDFTTEEKFMEERAANNEEMQFPTSPGVFALQKPYEKVVCLMSANCPARYVNDCLGVAGTSPNIKIVQHDDPRQLQSDQSLQLFLQAQAIRDIEPFEQLFLSYGKMFWDTHQ